MKCLYCGADDTRVANSRPGGDASTWRRRRCRACRKMFTTREDALTGNLFVVKRSGSRQRFAYEKLLVSIFLALNTRKDRDNGDDAKAAKRVADLVLRDVHARFARDRTVASRQIILLTYAHLKKIRSSFADNYVYYSDYRLRIARGSRA